MRSLAPSFTLLLAACGSQPAADGYAFGEPEFERLEVDLRVVVHPSAASLRRQFPGATAKGEDLMAWAVISQAGNRCEVHIVDPRVTYAPEWMGHEMAHCIYGRWHGAQ